MLQIKPARWAIVRNGTLLLPPMSTPYAIADPETGDILDFPAMTDAERDAAGFVPVEQRNWREIDEQIEQRTTPETIMENGLPVEVHGYRFIPSARQNMIANIDAQAEAQRSRLMTSFPLQVVEYQEARDEAMRFLALTVEEQAAQIEDDWPYLSGDIGVTSKLDGSGVCASLLEAAQSVRAAYELCQQQGAAIRKKRLRAKHLIEIAETVESAFLVYQSAWNE
ncbi:hypothetical protein LH427_15905 [Laribacter hongkongensis]|uniref:hypothetical protein n=1 Tax=Laribacter hongkongensis TaxID=168471 RepID=UPI001EFDDAE8|nr:hypothetical protein [Laribacter hongkongensis]MCG8999783.1 hypothetical protein [Laribacter hongkongensis]MCG9063368.1 hypothetical protein [Laribacter hongkongensis]